MAEHNVNGSIAVENLRCEYSLNPLGIESLSPRLSWWLVSQTRGARQTAYRVRCASTREILASDQPDLWDSGRVESDQSVHVEYAGKTLKSTQRCWWKVRVWDQDGVASAWGPSASWEMGLLKSSDWLAQWIAGEPIPVIGTNTAPPVPLLRKMFALKKEVCSARAFVCGLGYFELYANGRKVGDRVLDPGFTRYDRRALYVSLDLTDHLKQGANALGVMLGNGWYNCSTKEVWSFEHAAWRDVPKLLLQLHVTFADGTKQVVKSDPSWKSSLAPIVFDGLRNGETYDARLEQPGWDTADFDDSAWSKARVIPGPGGALISQTSPPCRVTQTIEPVSVTEPKPGVFVFDVGENIAGWSRLRVSGPAGTEVTLRHAEKLSADGDIDQGNINTMVKSGDMQTDRYILRGSGGVEVWEPRFCYHGFRYVQVTGFPGRPEKHNLSSRVVNTDFEEAGQFECSSGVVNRIQKCTRRSFVGNFHSIPTDCPQREKNGWTGDAQLAAEQALWNYAAAPAYAKWMGDFRDAQRPNGQLPGIVPTGGWGYNWGSGPAWDSATVLIPWYVYLYCGDRRILEDQYDTMKRYVDYMATMATNDIVKFGLGDWCPPGHTGGYGFACPESVTSTGYYYVDALTVAAVAEMMGKSAEAKRYRALAARIRKAFNRELYDPRNGEVAGASQTGQGCALYQGLAEPAEVARIIEELVRLIEANEGKLTFGILGAKYVMHTLAEHGHTELAYAMATRSDYPSWAHWLERGATSLWEDWEGGNSLNHIMFGDISNWFYRVLAGINPDPQHPGFRHTVIRPRLIKNLTWARASHHSPYGVIRCEWMRENGRLHLDLELPPNTTATLYLSTANPTTVKESGAAATSAPGVKAVGVEAGVAVFTLGAGKYTFDAADIAGG